MPKALRENIRRLRNVADLSVSEAARRGGIHRVAWIEIEQGRNPNPTAVTLEKVAAGLGVKLADLFIDEAGESVTVDS